MNSNEIKILSNMMILLPKIDMKNSYTEEEYFYIFQLINGYQKLEYHFQNKDIINKILYSSIKKYKLIDLIKTARNRYSHIDKNDGAKEIILLQSIVDKKKINKLIQEIKIGMDIIFQTDLNQDAYKLIMNTRAITSLFEAINYSFCYQPYNEFDKYCRKELKKIMDKFNYENSTEEDFERTNEEIVNFYNTERVKKGIIEIYDEDIYNRLMKMMSDDICTEDGMLDLINRIKNYNQLRNR